MSRPPRKLLSQLAAADRLLDAGEAPRALEILEPLCQTHPANVRLLDMLIQAYGDIGDWEQAAWYGQQLLPLTSNEAAATALNNLIVAHSHLAHPALIRYYAQQLVTSHPGYESRAAMRSLLDSVELFLDEHALPDLNVPHLSREEQIEVLISDEKIHLYLSVSQHDRALATANAALKVTPDRIPLLNNLSLATFMAGQVDEAMTLATRVLTLAPDNMHALANLTRFTFLTGRFDEARVYAGRMRQSPSATPDLATKQAEALAFLGDDEGVREAYERVKGVKGLPPLLLHLAATAYFRLGQPKKSWQLWRQAVKRDPSFALAQNNLADETLPESERNAPWYWPLPYWLAAGIYDEFSQILIFHSSKGDHRRLRQELDALLERWPYLLPLFAHILERGDHEAREFVLSLLFAVAGPERAEIAYKFGQGRYGTFEQRMRALQFVTRERPSLLPADKTVYMWFDGQQRAMRLMAMEITNEPEPSPNIPRSVVRKFERATNLLQSDELDKAERLLQEVLAAVPDFPSALNQLALVYERQGRSDEAYRLVEETHARFPDYLFARAALARRYIDQGRLDEASELITPLWDLTKLHYTEFTALAHASIELAHAREQPETAQHWLAMWAQVAPDDPERLEWALRLGTTPVSATELLDFISRTRRRKTRG